MGNYPGIIIEELQVLRVDEPQEFLRARFWFLELVAELQFWLETDAESMREINSKVKQEHLI